MAAGYSNIVTLGEPRKRTFLANVNTLIAARQAYCNQPRAATYYVSNSGGNDSNNGTSTATPWKSISKINSFIAANTGGNYAILLKNGDNWRTAAGIQVVAPNITIGSYGLGYCNSPGMKPILNGFTLQFSSGSWSKVSGTMYSQACATNVGWVRFGIPTYNSDTQIDPGNNNFSWNTELYNELSNEPYAAGGNWGYMWSQATSSATVASATTPTWWYDSAGTDPNSGGTATLYVNCQSSAAPWSLEAAPMSPARSVPAMGTANGVCVGDVDGCYIYSIRADGFGMTPASATQFLPFMFLGNGTNCCVFDKCDGFYSSSHCIGHEATSAGGICLLRRCRAGWCNSGGIPYVFYSPGGGHEGYADDCETLTGCLSIASAPSYPDAGGFLGCAAFVAHCTTSTLFGLMIQRNHRIRTRARNWCNTNWGQDPQFSGAPATPAAATLFVIGFDHDAIPANYLLTTNYAHTMTPDFVSAKGGCMINCRWRDPSLGDVVFDSGATAGVTHSINCQFDYSMENFGNGFTYIGENQASSWSFYNCDLSLNFSMSGANHTDWWTSGHPNGGVLSNSVVAIRNGALNYGYEVNWSSTTYQSGASRTNAFLGFSLPSDDVQSITLASDYRRGTPMPGDELYQAGSAAPDGVVVDYDFYGNFRVVPSIGSVDANTTVSLPATDQVAAGKDRGDGTKGTANMNPIFFD